MRQAVVETYDLASWTEFDQCIQEIRNRYEPTQRNYPDGRTRKNRIIFRGQKNSDWPLESTLERRTNEQYDVRRYLEAALRYIDEIESFTSRSWNIEPSRAMEANQTIVCLDQPLYDFLAYLRHHGFPSPLLDWTESTDVAAYFAYWEERPADRVAIYAFIETPRAGKTYWGKPPRIFCPAVCVKPDPRHEAQKAFHTFSTKREPETTIFCSFMDAIRVSSRQPREQDILIKITIPGAERKLVLRVLNKRNINHFTLFPSEDALVKSLAARVFDLETEQ